MATARRGAATVVNTPLTVVDRLFAEPFAFDFFQAMRLLERLKPEARPVGRGGDPVAEAVRLLDAGRATRRPQDSALATFAPKLTREEALIRWDEPAARIVNRVRAFDPWPVAYTLRGGEALRVWRASALPR